VYTVENHSAIRDEILPFVTTQMEMEVIMLSEISKPGTEKQALPDLTHGESKSVNLIEAGSRMVVTRGWRE
jgi:hypothetical protein